MSKHAKQHRVIVPSVNGILTPTPHCLTYSLSRINQEDSINMLPSDVQPAFRLLLVLVFAFLSTPAGAFDDRGRWTAEDPCPVTIHATVPGGSPFGTYEAVHKAMRTCNNITELHMRTTGGSCTEFPDGFSLPFKLDGSDKYLSVPQVLSLEEYQFDSSEWQDIRSGGLHWSNEDGYLPAERRSMDNMELWLEAMDFSRVHTLSIKELYMHPKGKGLYRSLPPALVGLESLSIQNRWIDWKTELEKWEAAPGPLPKNKWSTSPPPSARDFILAVHPSLKSLSWVGSGTCREDVFNLVLEYHGSTLKQLTWTNPEIEFSPRPIISMNQIRSLGKWAPGLTNLTIDLRRVGRDWPREQLKVIAESLPKLRNLVIYLNMKEEEKRSNKTVLTPKQRLLGRPALDAEAGLDMFETLRQFKAGDKLENVEFREGDWARSVYVMWDRMRDLQVWTKCSITGQDGQPECEAGRSEPYSLDGGFSYQDTAWL